MYTLLKRVGLLATLLALLGLVLPVPVAAQGPITPQHNDPTWSASYWSNRDLVGAPVLVRSETNLNYNWGSGSPAPEVPNDRFSARWLRYIDVDPGTYRFIVTSDDGVRVWVDDELILDKWEDHAETTFYADHYLSGGHHLIQVEYYENRGMAVASFSWVRADQAVGQWKAEYYNNKTLSGAPVLVRNDATIDFNWITGSPDPSTVAADNFSARWTRTMDVPAGNYTFQVTTDDGARLWVNGHLLIDAWFQQAAKLYTEDIYLDSGPVTIELEYFENTGFARIQLSWVPDVRGRPPSESVIVDNTDPGFVRGGAETSWREVAEGYHDSLLWTRNHAGVRPDYNWARWYPNLEPGNYQVLVYVPFRYTMTAQARYWIHHSGGLTLQRVDQSVNGDTWVSLGTYKFRGDGSDYLSLADVTFEAAGSRLVGFDAARWVPEP